MIKSFRYKALKRLFDDDDRRKLPANDVHKIRRILARLDVAETPRDMQAPSFDLRPLKGNRREFWAVTVRANWRVIFKMKDGDAFDVDYIDYR